MTDVLRTPDAAFAGLVDYPFAANYAMVRSGDGPRLRLHYVDAGPVDAAPVLLLHGEPTWSYLYRHFIPPLTAYGHRVLAPDLIGFGKSDKPAKREAYSYEKHVDWLCDWLKRLDVRNITLFCQDWGGLLGLRLVAHCPERFARLVISNSYLPEGKDIGPGFDAWRAFSQSTEPFKTGRIVDGGCLHRLSAAEIAAYDAPFPDARYQAGARQFPLLVPTTPDHPSVAENRAAWAVLEAFDKPVVTAFGDADKVLGHLDTEIHRRIPGTRGQPHRRIAAGHFCQEDVPGELVGLIHNFIRAEAA